MKITHRTKARELDKPARLPPSPAAAQPSRVRHVLNTALGQSHEVKAEVQACAEDLGSANELAKAHIADGASMLPAAQALQHGLAVEQRVQGCADDLQQLADNLSDGVDEVQAVEHALSRSRLALADSEAALALSRDAERTASQLAMHDQKTGLPNRTLFDDRLAQAIAGAERHGWLLAVLFLDLDRFKLVNDTHGHAAGDTVLTAVAERLMRNARDEDTVCRNGGDEFLYLLINPSGREAVARIAAMVREAIGSPVGLGATQFRVTPSIGIALYPEHGMSGPTLIAHADAAMYRAKNRGSAFEFFEPLTD
ncbi:GGDEF domain-containing protein [Paucibacter sp. M5-1]|uniref:GGDEF domain-containing protein n=1 Tax=Paucibacter sp. M5-1 TaxID=3015998 RepID=UPI0022B864D3|nr:GGDEF domain-containing protein [Paucibacter sp. M5-1]MCZ7882929.1 GGDEF domain-containing protein [Paucibacter sp. M5-1]